MRNHNGHGNPFDGMNNEDETTDAIWLNLIDIAVKHKNRMGKFRSVRMDRQSVYMVSNVRDLAHNLVFSCVIPHWPAGFRRLSTVEEEVLLSFKNLHGKYHND